jgi:hypothetical protein
MIEHHHHYLLLLSVLWNLGIAYKAKKAVEDEDAKTLYSNFLLQKLELFTVPLVCGWVIKNRV